MRSSMASSKGGPMKYSSNKRKIGKLVAVAEKGKVVYCEDSRYKKRGKNEKY